MSIERELLQRAINELVDNFLPDTATKDDYPSTIELIEEIKSVLDKPEQIPFCWWFHDDNQSFFLKNKRDIMAGPSDEWEEKHKDNITPLYISPNQDRKPLTDDVIMFLTIGKTNPLGGIYASSIIEFARCIEEAHDIKDSNAN